MLEVGTADTGEDTGLWVEWKPTPQAQVKIPGSGRSGELGVDFRGGKEWNVNTLARALRSVSE